jgi:uncharacterized membrane protein
MSNKKNHLLICGILVLAALTAGLALYTRLPERVPSNWDVHGQVIAHTTRTTAVLFIPALMAAFMLLYSALPAISPRRFEVDNFRPTYAYKMVLMVAAMGYSQGMLLWAALTPKAPVNRAVLGGGCVVVALMGNVLGRVKRNFYIGVRTPWTLASEPVWYATHRLAGKTVVAAGILGLVLVIVLSHPLPVIILLFVGCMIPMVYSFIYYKRLEKQGADL